MLKLNHATRHIALFFAAAILFPHVSACGHNDTDGEMTLGPSAKTKDGNEGTSGATEQTNEAVSALAIQLPVPHQKQFDTGCWNDNWCCGITSGNMATAYLHGIAPTAEYLKKGYEHLGLNSCCHDSKDGSKGLNIYEVADVADQVGNASGSTGACMTFQEMKTKLQANLPVAVAVKYGHIASERRCANFLGNHMVLVIGFKETEGVWIVNDPLCSRGASSWPSQEFRSAATALTNGCSEAHGVFFGL